MDLTEKYENSNINKIDQLNKEKDDLNEYGDRIDADLSKFKNYFDDMKLDTMKQMFEKIGINVEDKDLINDNLEEWKDDIKEYSKIATLEER